MSFPNITVCPRELNLRLNLRLNYYFATYMEFTNYDNFTFKVLLLYYHVIHSAIIQCTTVLSRKKCAGLNKTHGTTNV